MADLGNDGRSDVVGFGDAGVWVSLSTSTATAPSFQGATFMGDQVYSVWRNFTPGGAPPANCRGIGGGFVTESIVCSGSSAQTWTAPVVIGNGDFPRVTTGPDGVSFDRVDTWDEVHVTMPTEALVRLIYGRMGPEHTPDSIEADAETLHRLRAMFPGV